MPEFNPPLSAFSMPPPGIPLPPERRRYSKAVSPPPKPGHYSGVYQRSQPPADYHRSASPPHQPYRWPPSGPPDEPAHPPPHPDYRRDSWDYRFREPAVGPPPSFSSGRPPSPFHEWSRPPPPRQGWSPRRGSDGDWDSRRDWDEREGGPSYGPSRGWDRPPSPPPRDWQGDPYARRPLPPVDQPRGSPPLVHEPPGWAREPVSHFDQYERDMHEDWSRPDDWSEGNEMSPHMYPNPAHPAPYGPPGRPRGRSFMQDRRPPPPSGSGYSPVQPSPRGPGPLPLDNPSRRHSQHDRRYSGPGYSSDARGFVPNNPRRQFQRGSFNDPNRAKLVPRDQLLVANTSIKVEDPDGHTLITPNPASASSASPEKSVSTGKRSRTDSVAADAEPASRRPSPFTSSTLTVIEPVATTAGSAPENRVESASLKEQSNASNIGPSTGLQSQTDDQQTSLTQATKVEKEHVDSKDLGDDSTSSALGQFDSSRASIDETAGARPADIAQDVKDDMMDSEPSTAAFPDTSATGTDANGLVAAPNASTDVSFDYPSSETDSKGPQLPLLQFEYVGFSDDEEDSLPPTSVREALPLRSLDLNKLALNVEDVLQTNLKLASHRQPIRPVSDDIPTLGIFSMPDDASLVDFNSSLRGILSEQESHVEAKVDSLEEEYLTLNETWTEYCQMLDEAAEQRRVHNAEAAAAAAQNVVSEPVAAQTRSTRRNPVVNMGVMADAVHSDLEMEKVMNNMRDAAAVDPDLLARPNLARIPDMVTVTEPDMLRLTFDDENGQVDDPIEFYDFKGRTVEHWTTEERDIFIDQHRVHNKRFDKIAEHLPHKTTSQCVKYYYLMKKVPAFRAQVKRGQRRRLGRGGHQGKASALMADIEKEEDGTIASPREDEFIATRRSRRHAATANAGAAAQSATPPPSTSTEPSKPRRPRVVELARADSFDTDRAGTSTPMSFASDSEAGGDVPHPSDLDLLLSTQPQRKSGPGRGRRWAYKGEVANGSGGSVRLDGAEPSKKRPATTSYWTVAERTALKQNLLRHGRNWNQIAAVIQTKTSIQAKNYYFNNQKEMSVFVRAWEKEQNKEGKSDTESASTKPAEAGSSTSASPGPIIKKEEPRKSTGPVTIQPAPGQAAPATAPNTAQPPKAGSGRGNAHYPNVIPHPQPTLAPNPQPTFQQQFARAQKVLMQSKPKTPVGTPNQAPVIPTPPLPLPGPTFRAWPVSSAPPPPPMSYAFGFFPGASGPGAIEPSGPGAPAAGVTPASGPGPSTPRSSGAPNGTGATGSSSSPGTGGVQRGNLNHYPGPMRYQPYPVTATNIGGSVGGMNKGKAPPPRAGFPLKSGAPTMQPTPPGMGMSRAMPGRQGAMLARSTSGQFGSWNGEGKGKKPV